MGHKVNPLAFRLGYISEPTSKWFSKNKYADFLHNDQKIKYAVREAWKDSLVDMVEIERGGKNLVVSVTVAKPGVAIGRGGAGAEELKQKIAKISGMKIQDITLNVREINEPALSATVIAQQMAEDIEKRAAFRRTMKMAIEKVIKAGAKGVKVTMSGRLNGAEIARTETLAQGKVPLHTLRANIDFSRAAAFTTYGTVGIKVWIYKGEIFK